MSSDKDIPDGFTCSHCGTILKRESSFNKHKCREMERHEQLTSPRGQAAYNVYLIWLKKKKRAAVNKKSFGASRSFTFFYKFVEWKNTVHLPDVSKYVEAMVIWNFEPAFWTNDDVYNRFLEYLDATSSVDEHIKYTYDTLCKVARAAECSVASSLSALDPHMVISYVKARKISPWMLIKMPSFKLYFSGLNGYQRHSLQGFIRPEYWKKRIHDNPKDTQLIVDFIEAVGL